MQNFIFGKVIQRVDSDGKRYFINLGTGDKVLAKGTIKANKIELIPSRVSLKDLEYAEKLKEGKIIGEQELASIRNFFTSAEREKKELKRMQKSDGENMADFIFRSTAYHEIVNAIILCFMPKVDEIRYTIPCQYQQTSFRGTFKREF